MADLYDDEKRRDGIILSPDDRITLSRRPAPDKGHKAVPKPAKSEPQGKLRREKAQRDAPPSKQPKAPKTLGGLALLFLRRAASALLVLGIWAGIALAAVFGFYALDLPDLSGLTATLRKPSIAILAADDEQITAFGDVYGESLTLDQMPKWLPEAVLATEDRHFYSHFGLDPIGFTRAMLVNLRAGHYVQGGSTITQQLAKNLFLSPDKNFKRKIQELELALWLEHKFTKQQILTLYLNRVYLGSGTWGVDAAARRYFDISATQLNLYQSALLGGLMKAPSRYNPQNDRTQSAKRTAQVLANMVAAGYISQDEADQARNTGQATVKQISHTGRYFADWIHDQVAPIAGTDRDIVVHTTLDLTIQRRAEAELEALLAGPGAKAGASQGAIVVMTPDGAVKALVGGRNYATSQFNRATQGMRQPGSSFKAFLYLAAMEQGSTADDIIEDSPITTGKYRPENYTHKYKGPITLRKAFADSSNVAAVRLIERIGPKRVVSVAKRLGITTELQANASLALGTSEVPLIEMTAAYATFANGGQGVFAYGYPEVDGTRGEALYQRQGGGTGQVIMPGPLKQMTDLMVAVVQEGSGKAAQLGDRPVAGKTGTTQDYRDAWFIGFTADYVCGVWLGNDDDTPLNRITGGTLPAQLWHNVMLATEQGLPVRPLPGQVQPEIETPVASGDEAKPAGEKDNDDSIWSNLVHMLTGDKKH
jgi:penicillin-binding protein 1A